MLKKSSPMGSENVNLGKGCNAISICSKRQLRNTDEGGCWRRARMERNVATLSFWYKVRSAFLAYCSWSQIIIVYGFFWKTFIFAFIKLHWWYLCGVADVMKQFWDTGILQWPYLSLIVWLSQDGGPLGEKLSTAKGPPRPLQHITR